MAKKEIAAVPCTEDDVAGFMPTAVEFGLLVPAVQKVREAAARASCSNNLSLAPTGWDIKSNKGN